MSSSNNQELILGNYRVGKCIGQGTFGKVRLGVHIITEQKVAVKTLQKEKIVEQSDIERVTREICILKILRHPNIIQLYEIIETKTDIHLIMEYAEGGELFDYIVRKKRIEEKEAVQFMQQILSGVAYIHKNGIVHRDLKPQNLLLDYNKNIKIVDFGLSNQYKPGQKLKTACGSPCYAAPEMIAGKRYQCLNTDIWSCGIILYAMLCGYLPFEDPNTNKLYKKIIGGDFQLPKILSNDAKQILKNILNVNPDNRFKISQIRQSKWYNLIGHKYEAQGIIIGKDFIEPDQKIIRKLEKYRIDVSQANNYIINNRHNNITALYYLLKLKIDRQPKAVDSSDQIKSRRKEQSPVIYRPQRKNDYVVLKKARENKDTSKNDSMNVSNIISSLVEANKNKLVNHVPKFIKNGDKFDKLQEFKLFPKNKTSSIHQPQSSSKLSATKRGSVVQEKSYEVPKQIYGNIENLSHKNGHQNSIEMNSSREDSLIINKKRQELSDQLKQISVKIDRQITQLKKQNNNVNQPIQSATNRKRDSIKPNSQYLDGSSMTNRRKTLDGSEVINNSSNFKSQLTRPLQVTQIRDKNNKNDHKIHTSMPKVHTGPFNTQCIFIENQKLLLDKICVYLDSNNIKYTQNQPYSLILNDGEIISIQSLQGTHDVNIIKLGTNQMLNREILNILSS